MEEEENNQAKTEYKIDPNHVGEWIYDNYHENSPLEKMWRRCERDNTPMAEQLRLQLALSQAQKDYWNEIRKSLEGKRITITIPRGTVPE